MPGVANSDLDASFDSGDVNLIGFARVVIVLNGLMNSLNNKAIN